MSTTINVTVDSGGLSAQNRQQVNANRQARLEQDRLLNLSAKALDERAAAQAAKGLSVDGQPLYGTPFIAPRPREEPAAHRQRGIPSIFLEPQQGYGIYGIRALTKNTEAPVDFVRDRIYDTPNLSNYGEIFRDPNYVDAEINFSLAAGKGGLSIPRPVNLPGTNVSAGYYVLSKFNNVSAVSEYSEAFKSPNIGNPPAKRLQQNGTTLFDIQGKTLLQDYTQFTFECWLRPGDKKIISEYDNLVSSAVSVTFASCTLSSTWAAGVGGGGGGYVIRAQVAGTNINATIGTWNRTSTVNHTQWQHCAITRDGTNLKAFINGTLVGAQTLTSSYFPGSSGPLDAYQPYGNFALLTGTVLSVAANAKPALHGYRVTPKVLYTESFTPQFPLIGFA